MMKKPIRRDISLNRDPRNTDRIRPASVRRVESDHRTHEPSNAPKTGQRTQRPISRTYQYSKFKNRPASRGSNNTPVPTKYHRASSIPPPEEGVLRIIPIGGVEQVGQNMTALEYGNDIIIVDAGFEFSKRDTPGIDYMIPNTKYLEERKEKIRGLFITHGHYDHIGAIPHVMEKMGNPPIYSREFGAMMILKRQEEFVSSPKINMNIVKPN